RRHGRHRGAVPDRRPDGARAGGASHRPAMGGGAGVTATTPPAAPQPAVAPPAARRPATARWGLRLLPVVPFAGLLMLWVIGWAVARPSLATFPSVTQVVQTLGDLIESGELWRNIAASMGRWSLALVTATITGVGLGVLAGLNGVVARILEPLAIFFTAMSGI